jgi:predicted transposase YbfD/YdcC
VLGQLKVADKSNEITAVPPLLRALELAGGLVTVDALGCQKQIAKEIIEADADYVLALKGNQETAFDEVQRFLDDAVAQVETVEKDHGRLEIRRYWLSAELDWFGGESRLLAWRAGSGRAGGQQTARGRGQCDPGASDRRAYTARHAGRREAARLWR